MNKKIIQGIVKGFNTIQYEGRLVNCWSNPKDSGSIRQASDLSFYIEEVVELEGFLYNDLWETNFIKKYDRAKEARSLNDLMRIRAVNREVIEKVNANLGTALGYKWARKENTKHPCVIIFVPKKMKPSEVKEEEEAPKLLIGNNSKWCLTDVICGGKAAPGEYDRMLPLSSDNQKVKDELGGGDITPLIGGIKLARHFDSTIGDCKGGGTAAIAVQDKLGGRGFLTNQHVAGEPETNIYHPNCNASPIGKTEFSETHANFKEWYDGITDESNAKVKCDYAYVKVENLEEIEEDGSKLQSGLHRIGKVGPLLEIVPDTMDIIGQKVISIGCTRGIQRGMIVAYSYEYWDSLESYYTDLLIIGDEGNAFSAQGDSGKLILTDDEEHRPIALHWGGRQETLRHGKEQEVWGYAIDLGKILKHLEKYSENHLTLSVLE